MNAMSSEYLRQPRRLSFEAACRRLSRTLHRPQTTVSKTADEQPASSPQPSRTFSASGKEFTVARVHHAAGSWVGTRIHTHTHVLLANVAGWPVAPLLPNCSAPRQSREIAAGLLSLLAGQERWKRLVWECTLVCTCRTSCALFWCVHFAGWCDRYVNSVLQEAERRAHMDKDNLWLPTDAWKRANYRVYVYVYVYVCVF